MHGRISNQHSGAYLGLVYFTAAIFSVFISYLTNMREVVINPDAICYLQSAQSMPMGLHFVTHLCNQANWPLYPALIFSVASTTKISILNSAHLLNGVFSLISVVTFMEIIRFLNGTKRMLWLAAIVILLGHEFNHVREFIIRDHGFWAFYLLSILFLLHYMQSKRWYVALAWNASLVIATLFRIEGAIFLLFLPFISFFCKEQTLFSKFKSFLKLNILTFGALILITVWMSLHPQYSLEQLGRLVEVKSQFLQGIAAVKANFNSHVEILKQQMLNQSAADEGKLIMLLVLISWYVISVAGTLSLIYFALVIYAWWKQLLKQKRTVHLILWSYIAINVVVTGVFLVENMFLTQRYLMALSLTLMLWVPFALENLFQQWKQQKWPLVLALIAIIFFSLGGIFNFGYSKNYIREAGYWLESNVPQEATLYSNDNLVMYYSKHFGNNIFKKYKVYFNQDIIVSDQWKQYDYLALKFNKKALVKNPDLLKKFGMPIQTFANERGDKVIIYKNELVRG